MVSHCTLISVSLVTKDVAQFFIYLIGCLNVLFDGLPVQHFPHFSYCFSFSYLYRSSLYILDINPLLTICVANNFRKFMDGHFTVRNRVIWRTQALNFYAY